MGSTEIVVHFPITDPPPFCGSQKLQKFHNPSQPQPSTLQNPPERSCRTPATSRNPRSPLSTPESTASFPATPVAAEPPMRPAVPALQRARRGASGGRKGHGGIFRSFLWGSLGIRLIFRFASSSIFPVLSLWWNKLQQHCDLPQKKKGAFQPPKFMGLRMKLRLCDSELTSILCFLLSCGAVTYQVFQYFDTPMQVNTHCECPTRLQSSEYNVYILSMRLSQPVYMETIRESHRIPWPSNQLKKSKQVRIWTLSDLHKTHDFLGFSLGVLEYQVL